MSASLPGVSRNRSGSLHSGMSSHRGRTGEMGDFTMAPTTIPRYFEPCGATASMFLYAQGTSVVVCHHDTLAIERRFARHAHEVQLLAVDNLSEQGAGRCVVSYDAGQNAIVWDLMTGDEIARFASYEHLTAAAWMRSGNVAFGNSQGTIILFEPATSEHISTRTIDQITVTALAPSGDCRTFAIGYQNGQCLVATLQPRFTVLHNLTTSRTPSPIVTLSWHASSSRQRSDMLSSQTQDGDLRVWSVAKTYNSNDPAKVVRALKRNDVSRPGANWMAWSKNGRIIQYTDSETLSWDVRTKHVTHDMIPTLEHVRGLAVYGPGATLFTLGPNNTVQQFDLNAPAIMVANVQHPANLLPPSPPVSIEEQAEKATTIASESEITFNPSDVGLSESDNDYQEQMQHGGRYRSNRNDHYETGSMISSQSGISSVSGAAPRDRYQRSVRSRATENTYISAGESTRRGAYKNSDMYSQASFSTTSTRSRRQPSRLRHEMDYRQQQQEPAGETQVDDLFRFTRSRLSDIPYKTPAAMDNGRLTNDHLRRQMLSIIFGWHKEIEDLIADEMGRHPTNSSSRIMLGKWLGIIDQDIMNASAESMTSSDWMLLALSGVSNHQGPQHKIGRAYVTTLLEKGDVHAASTILIGMGDHNDAIEIYVSHKRYMEALILTCLFFPSVWERQAAIIKSWGAWAIQHDQQDLAIRCFACAGQESTEPWASPSAAQLTFQNNVHSSIGEVLSPPLSPPSLNRGPQRQIGKTSALKLITSFGDHGSKAKFFNDGDGGQTPLAAGVTPIAESAIDHDGDPTTAFIRPSNLSGFNTPTSVKSFASSTFGGRNPLPSIGETHGENATPMAERQREGYENPPAGVSIPRAATASPMMVRGPGGAPQHVEHDQPTFRMERQKSIRGNGPRDRIPAGLKLQLESLDNQEEADRVSPTSMASSTRYHWPSRRRGPASVSSVTSASTSRSVRTTATGGRHLESYIHSLDAANSHKKKSRSRHASRDRGREDARTDDRGRTPVQSNYQGKRSPTSPVPMSPEELVTLGSSKYNDGADPVGHTRKASKSRASSRGTSRRPSPERRPSGQDSRGRSRGPEVVAILSPTSPQPMSALPKLDDTEDEEDYARAIEAQERFRQRHNRSGAQQQDRSRSRSRRVGSESGRSFLGGRGGSLENASDLRSVREERQRKKEQAARELEERRKELSRNSRAGPIPHPSEITPLPFRLAAVEMASSSGTPSSPPRSRTADPLRNPYGRGNVGTPSMGLPATPKAMRLVMDSDGAREAAPAVPSIPASYRQSTQSNQSVRSTQSNRASPDKGLQESPKAADLQGPMLLAPTVYQPPRAPISRCMSAPIPDQPSNRNQRSGGQSRSNLGRNTSVRSKNGMDLGHIEENSASSNKLPPRRGSYDDQIPPPPPAAPMLKELQHLAMPPPPPPAPLPHVAQVPPPPPPPPMMPPTQAGSALASGMIEIVMDDDEPAPGPPPPPPVAAPITVPSTEITVPILPPPAPPSLKGHSRGRSTTDNSIAGRFSKATERLRSASRSRKDSGFRAQRSPEFAPAPYESIQPPAGYGQQGMRSPPPGPINPQYLPTGLNKSDLI